VQARILSEPKTNESFKYAVAHLLFPDKQNVVMSHTVRGVCIEEEEGVRVNHANTITGLLLFYVVA